MYDRNDISHMSDRATDARNLARLLPSLLTDEVGPSSVKSPPAQLPEPTALRNNICGQILTAIQDLVPTLLPNSPIFATFHDGQVHDPLGGGSYAFEDDVVGPILLGLINDEALSNDQTCYDTEKASDQAHLKNFPPKMHESYAEPPVQLPTRPITIHAGA